MYTLAAADSSAEVRDRADLVVDGTADDADISAALVTYGCVLLLPGTFRAAAPVSVPERALLAGVPGATLDAPAGEAGIVVRGDGASVRGFTVRGGTFGIGVRARWVQIRSMTVVDSGIDGITTAPGAEHVGLTGNHVRGCRRMGIAVNGAPARHVTIDGNLVEATGAAGLGIIGIAEYVTVSDNTTRGTGGDGVAGYNAAIRRVTVVGNTFDDPANHCVHLGGTDLVIANNAGSHPRNSGWFVRNHDGTQARRFVIEGNTLHETGRGAGILVQRASQGAICDNVIDRPRTHGAVIEDGDSVQVVGNTLAAARLGAGLRLHRMDGVSVAANVIRGNAGDGVGVRDYRRGATRNVTVAGGNQILNNGGRSVRSVEDSDYLVVTGNVLRANLGGDEPALVGAHNLVVGNLS